MKHHFQEISTATAWAIFAGGVVSSAAAQQSVLFSVRNADSGIVATAQASVGFTGNLIGNYDATLNPTGTRTKPGATGSFGSTENLAVPLSSTLGATGAPIVTGSSGVLRMFIDPGAGQVILSQYDVNLLTTGPIDIPVTATVTTETFRTRSPSSVYPGGSFPIPLTNVSLTALSSQLIGIGIGTLTPASSGMYTFSIPALLSRSATLNVGTQSLVIPALPALTTFSGSLKIEGESVVLMSTNPLESTGTIGGGLVIPPFDVAVPTLLPPGGTANLVMSLTTQGSTFGLTGSQTLVADGVPCPCIADFDLSGGTPDTNDIDAFFNMWLAGASDADANCSGGTPDAIDIQVFFEQWLAGGCGV